ncbi:MAG: alpha-1,2-fucosyltransferase [Oscillospiraceae bacterium]|jgi:hypothetical protein|nr:alpha-1,2-fucosyltransferase [Oscillospiraceae bacterium]
MIIVLFKGGMGNQMFQYAFYKKLSTLFNDVKIDNITYYYFDKTHNAYCLDGIFSIDTKIATVDEIIALTGYKKIKKNVNHIDKHGDKIHNIRKPLYKKLTRFLLYMNPAVRRRLLIRLAKDKLCISYGNDFFISKTYYLEQGNVYYGEYTKNVDMYYDGYWQDVRYFDDIRDDILKDYSFNKKLTGKNLEISKKIANIEKQAISIHVRRGDYKGFKIHDICLSIDYYEKAVKEIEERVDNVHYFVFSDDIEWVQESFEFLYDKECVYVDWNKGIDSYIDMQLMSLCKHNIIANSTFSWWGAYLNKNPNKIILSPKYQNKPQKIEMLSLPKDFNVLILD